MPQGSTLVTHSFLYAVGSFCNKLAGFLLLPVYTYFLSSADYGLIELLDIMVMMASILLGLHALGHAMVRLYQDDANTHHQHAIVTATLVLGLIIASSVALITTLSSDSIAEAFFKRADVASLLQLAFVSIIPLTLVEILLANIRLKQMPVFFVTFNFVRLLLSAGLNIYFIAYLQIGVLGFVYSNLITSSLACLFLLVHYSVKFQFRWDFSHLKSIAVFGYPFIFSSLAAFSIHFSDRLILNHYTDLSQIGLYSLAYKFAFLVAYLVGEPFNRSWSTLVYLQSQTSGWKQRFATTFTRYCFVLCLFSGLIIVFFDNLFGWMLDPKFFAATAFLPYLVLAYCIREQGEFFSHIICIRKNSKFIGKVSVFCALLNIGLSLWLIPELLVLGAVIATLLTWSAFTFILFIKQKSEYKIPYDFSQWMFPMMILGLFIIIEKVIVNIPFVINISVDLALLTITLIVVFYFKLVDLQTLRNIKNTLLGSNRP